MIQCIYAACMCDFNSMCACANACIDVWDRYHLCEELLMQHDVPGASTLEQWIRERAVCSAGVINPPMYNKHRTLEYTPMHADVYRDEMTFVAANSSISVICEHQFINKKHTASVLTFIREVMCQICSQRSADICNQIPSTWLEDTCERCRCI